MWEFINACFEFVGAWLAWRNAYEFWRTQKVTGVYSPMFVFSSLWALTCIPYYASVGHTWCALFAAVRCAGLAVWVLLKWSRDQWNSC